MVRRLQLRASPTSVARAGTNAFQIAGVIFGIMKDRRPLVATDDHMIESAWKIDARLASHDGESRFRETLSQYSCLTPYRLIATVEPHLATAIQMVRSMPN